MSPGDWGNSEEAISAFWVNSRCLDTSMKDFLFCLPEAHKEVKVKMFSNKLGAKTV